MFSGPLLQSLVLEYVFSGDQPITGPCCCCCDGCFLLLSWLLANSRVPLGFFFVFVSVLVSLKCLMTLGCPLTFETRALSSCWAALCEGAGSNCGVHWSQWLGTFPGELLTLSTINFDALSQSFSPERNPSGSCLEDNNTVTSALGAGSGRGQCAHHSVYRLSLSPCIAQGPCPQLCYFPKPAASEN